MKKYKITKKTRTLLNFLGVTFISGVIGGMLGGFSEAFSNSSIEIAKSISNTLVHLAFPLMLIPSLPALFYSIFTYRTVKAAFHSMEDDDLEKLDALSDKLNILMGMLTIFHAWLMLCAGLECLRIQRYHNVTRITWFLTLFIVFIFTFIFLQRKAVELLQEINPEKRGDVLDLHFNKQWLDSCDELERVRLYKCGYTAFKQGQMLFPIVLALLIIASLQYDIGILPLLVIGILWIQQLISYSYESMKPYKKSHGKE